MMSVLVNVYARLAELTRIYAYLTSCQAITGTLRNSNPRAAHCSKYNIAVRPHLLRSKPREMSSTRKKGIEMKWHEMSQMRKKVDYAERINALKIQSIKI